VRTWPALVVSGIERSSGPDRQPVRFDDAITPVDAFAAALTDFDVAAVDERSSDLWRVFFHSAAVRDHAVAELSRQFPHLTFTSADVPDEDWAARSQADLRAIRIGALVVAPPWDVPLDASTVITILPSTGFGTGHHATTRLCLAALQALHPRGRAVVDVGTGSGVLAIAASRLGAASVVGVDDDSDAIDAARANLALNPGAVVELRLGDFRRAQLPAADIVLANLTGGLLVSAAGPLQQLTAPGGRLILSGFTEDEEGAVVAAFSGRAIECRAQEDEWICATLRS
jgi:ribosomal protein L11 methyltransferase